MESPEGRARVVASFGRRCLLQLPGGELRDAAVRRSAGSPVCGDEVEVGGSAGDPVVTRILERRNVFARADRRGRRQVVAANVDLVIIVIAPEPPPTRDLVNRYLVACESLELEAALCINKVDRLDPADAHRFDDMEAIYRSLGHPVIRTSCKAPPGIEALRRLVDDRTCVLVGQSGVGKSSLAERLLPDRELTTRALSRATGKGRHTTTRTTLYPLAGGGELMDSPGVWEYGIWTMEIPEVAAGFREFERWRGQCRFANCTHRTEPGCAVAAAAERGEIDRGRLASYRRIVAALPASGPGPG